MALKFQYNKTFLNKLRKDLQMREKALPTLQAKESALRIEVKKARNSYKDLCTAYNNMKDSLEPSYCLWTEFPSELVKVEKIEVDKRVIAGVSIPTLKEISFRIDDDSLVSRPSWLPAGIELYKGLIELSVRMEIAERTTSILEYARKKTTQKVNLYEKVQIPGYKESILKIKRYMEDEENLAKSSQKILKEKLAREAEEAAQ